MKLWKLLATVVCLSILPGDEAQEISEASLGAALAGERAKLESGRPPPKKRRRVSAAILAHGAFAPPSSSTVDIQRKAQVLQGASRNLNIANEEEAVRGPAPAFGGVSGPVFRRGQFGDTDEIDSFFARPDVLPGPHCITTSVKCDLSSRYRSIDGRCNNLKHPEFGSASSPYRRLAEPAYDDNIGSPRTQAEGGGVLPSPRAVSVGIHETRQVQDDKHSHMIMQWGQFVDHDITLTPQARATSGGGWGGQSVELGVQDCSACPGSEDDGAVPVSELRAAERRGDCFFPGPVGRRKRDVSIRGRGPMRPCFPVRPPPVDTSDVCFPIPIPAGDPVFEPGTCMHFVRSAAGQLSLGARQQMNQITSFLDASNVYGSDLVTSEGLRAPSGGQLVEGEGGRLPAKHEPACKREAVASGHRCFRAGDIRCNVQPGLMSMHTLWLAHHNRIAKDLARINPHWEDNDKLYQEARRIVIAQQQHITYNEFLPEVLGPEFMENYGLFAQKEGRYYSYDGDCDATVYNEFASAAFRFGHSLIDTTFNRKKEGGLNLTGHFMDPSLLSGTKPMRKVQSILEGLIDQKAQKFDRFVTDVMRNNLFGSEEELGMDIVALNIQRGRDHGIQSYYKYRQVFGLSQATTWAQIEDIMRPDAVVAFKKIYDSPMDIDLYSGMLAEPSVKGGMVGELCAHILASQFHRLRDCDRFYYENGREKGSFSSKQLTSLRQTTLSAVVCDHVDEPSQIASSAFVVGGGGANLDCRPGAALGSVNLEAWRQNPPRSTRNRTKRKRERNIKIRPRCFVEPNINVAT